LTAIRSGKPAGRQARARPASAGPTASAAHAIAKVTPARAAAFDVLTQVGEGTAHSDDLLHSGKAVSSLSLEDRNLATALVMGVLRWQIALDARLAKLLARPDQRLAEPVALALRIGALQILHMDRIPAHAALSESVELCRAAGHPHAAGMVNAVLRKLAAGPREEQSRDQSHAKPPRSGPAPHEVPTAAFAERLAHPLWLVERWVAVYGREAAFAICEYDQREPARGALFSEAIADTGEATDATPAIDDGSRLVAELAAAAIPPTPSSTPRVWDCCAAPGGKTLLLAQRLGQANAAILATDIGARRLAQTAARLRRHAYAGRVECLVADAAAPAAIDGLFDLILCDVPCSGTGTLARNPEIRLRLRVEDLARQAARQRAILTGALSRLAPGGRLVYSTCSLEPEENERVIESVASSASLRRLPIGPFMAHLASTGILPQGAAVHLERSAVREGALRTLPGVHPCDGFYAAVLERN
jgi:16S rRNA (cytosine967-C5)-methyltransferase